MPRGRGINDFKDDDFFVFFIFFPVSFRPMKKITVGPVYFQGLQKK
jgi:hypothetical protein